MNKEKTELIYLWIEKTNMDAFRIWSLISLHATK